MSRSLFDFTDQHQIIISNYRIPKFQRRQVHAVACFSNDKGHKKSSQRRFRTCLHGHIIVADLNPMRQIGFPLINFTFVPFLFLLVGIFCLVMCISNLLFVQSTGFYLLEIISSASSIPLLLTGLAECIGVAFVYGMDK